MVYADVWVVREFVVFDVSLESSLSVSTGLDRSRDVEVWRGRDIVIDLVGVKKVYREQDIRKKYWHGVWRYDEVAEK